MEWKEIITYWNEIEFIVARLFAFVIIVFFVLKGVKLWSNDGNVEFGVQDEILRGEESKHFNEGAE